MQLCCLKTSKACHLLHATILKQRTGRFVACNCIPAFCVVSLVKQLSLCVLFEMCLSKSSPSLLHSPLQATILLCSRCDRNARTLPKWNSRKPHPFYSQATVTINRVTHHPHPHLVTAVLSSSHYMCTVNKTQYACRSYHDEHTCMNLYILLIFCVKSIEHCSILIKSMIISIVGCGVLPCSVASTCIIPLSTWYWQTSWGCVQVHTKK